MSQGIAVIGLGCRYPDAHDPRALWENVLAGRRAFRRLPPERLSLDDYPADHPDGISAATAAVLRGYAFDRVRFRVTGPSFRSTDMAHWLALDVAADALADAGFPDGRDLPRDAAGVLVGNTLTGDSSRANLMRLRWPYVRRVLAARLAADGWETERIGAWLATLEAEYKAPFPPLDEESLAGGLSNTIAGRICNHFDLRGGGFTVDGACASSLLAVAQACSALTAGDLDLAIAGGVDLSLDPFELVGFSRTGALSATEMRVYDRRADGFWPGEGCGLLVLMREADAVALGRRCYGVIRGWGIASDGGGGLTRPEADGQRLAIDRAYRRAGWPISDCALLEGHGTGTSVGDGVELRALNIALTTAEPRAPVNPDKRPAVGSIKANIGHTKAAAGAAGLIKALMALHTQLLPPATGAARPGAEPHAELTGPDSRLRLLRGGEPWPADRPLRAGVSSFGFGGIDVHVALEGSVATRRRGLTEHDRRLLRTAQDTELFLLEAEDAAALRRQAEALAQIARGLSYADLTDLAAHLAGRTTRPVPGLRAALIANSPERLAERLGRLAGWLADGTATRLDTDAGLLLAAPLAQPRIGFLFSGQAAPVRLDGGAWARRFAAVEALYGGAALPTENDGTTVCAQPAIIAAERTALAVLGAFGLDGDIAVGHSLGELAALHWAGALDGERLQRLARTRGRLMGGVPGPAGAMAAIPAGGDTVIRLLNAQSSADLVISCFNGAHQTVVSGPVDAIERFVASCRERDIAAQRLAVGHAFHSPLMAGAADELSAVLDAAPFEPLHRTVISTITGELLPEDADPATLLRSQLTAPVRFTEAARRVVAEADLLLELGPGQVLTGLIGELAPEAPILSVDAAGASLAPLLLAVGAAWVIGAPVKREALFSDRLTRPIDPDAAPVFLASPCEQAPDLDGAARVAEIRQSPTTELSEPAAATVGAASGDDDATGQDPLEVLRAVVAAKAELPIAAVADDSRLLVDLHLNSISVGQIVADVSRRLDLPPPAAPTDYADATLAAIAQSLQERRATAGSGTPAAETFPAGVDDWVHPFEIRWQPAPLPHLGGSPTPTDHGWQLMAADGAPALAACVRDLPGRGLLLWLPASAPEAQIPLLLEAGRQAVEQRLDMLALVQQGAAAAPLARTLKLEHPDIGVLILDAPPDAALPARIGSELGALDGFCEVRYDNEGRRLLPVLAPLGHGPAAAENGPVLGPNDVLLVSGGGKGIAAESALALARDGGAALALIGRSDPATDPALAQNLARLGGLGIRFHYARADVTDAEAVAEAVAGCEQALGPITALLHGAGVNEPRLLHALTPAICAATIAPKAAGLDHLLAAVDAERLRLLITFGSIIARSGLRGEADYALANEALARRTEVFAAAHPGCRCLCLEWSIWSGVGMGERLGRVDALLREGIAPIPPDAGVALLKRLAATADLPVRVVASGRLGGLPTVRPARQELPLGRFLDPVRLHVPGVELIVEPELSIGTDPYLAEHALAGEPLFPTVLGLEAMAQAATALLGRTQTPYFEQVALSAPIAVSSERPLVIRIAALARAANTVDVVIRSAVDGFQQDRFSARLRFGGTGAPADFDAAADDELPAPALDPACNVYATLLFHGGRFQRIQGYDRLDAWHCRFRIGTRDGSPWFSPLLPDGLLLGDPGSRDAGLHGIQACIPHARLLPIKVARIDLIDAALPGPWIAEARERARDGDQFTYDLVLRDRDGRVREHWHGLVLRRIEPIAHDHWHPDLLLPYLERRAEELMPGHRIALSLTSETFPTGTAATARGGLAVSSGAAAVLYRADGRPQRSDGHGLSAAHAVGLRLSCTGDGPVACDLEPVAARGETAWADLLGAEHLLLARALAGRLGEPSDTAATRIWCALECLKKAGAGSTRSLTLTATEPDGWALLASGSRRIATVRLLVQTPDTAHPVPRDLAIALLTEAIGAQL